MPLSQQHCTPTSLKCANAQQAKQKKQQHQVQQYILYLCLLALAELLVVRHALTLLIVPQPKPLCLHGAAVHNFERTVLVM